MLLWPSLVPSSTAAHTNMCIYSQKRIKNAYALCFEKERRIYNLNARCEGLHLYSSTQEIEVQASGVQGASLAAR